MKTITGVYERHSDAELAIRDLRAFGIADTDISCIYVDTKGNIRDAQTEQKVDSAVGTGAATGAIVGAIAGLVVVNGILPGLGTLFVAGPLVAALGLTGATATTLAAATTGLAAGGLIGSFVNLGISNADAVLYEALVRKGDILIIVRTNMKGTKEVFARSNAKEIREYNAE